MSKEFINYCLVLKESVNCNMDCNSCEHMKNFDLEIMTNLENTMETLMQQSQKLISHV